MCKKAILILACAFLTESLSAIELNLLNFTGTNFTRGAGTWVIPPGKTTWDLHSIRYSQIVMALTANITNTTYYNYNSNRAVNMYFTNGATIGYMDFKDTATSEKSSANWFMKGFVAVFMIGMLGVGMAWVKRIIAGNSFNE